MPPPVEADVASSGDQILDVSSLGASDILQAPLPKRQRSSAYGPRVHAMPVIPEELELSGASLNGAQKAMDLLNFALNDDQPDTLSNIQSTALPECARKALELLKFACANYDEEEDEAEDGKEYHPLEKPAILPQAKVPEKSVGSEEPVAAGWGIGCFSKKAFKIHNVGEGTIGNREETMDGEMLLEVDLEGGNPHARPLPPVVTVDARGLSRVEAGCASRETGKLVRALALMLFGLVNVQVIAIIVAAAFFAGGFAPAVAIACVGCLVWAAVFIFNLAVGAQSKLVLQRYLRVKQNGTLEWLARAQGKVVVVKGVVSKVDDKLLSSEFQTAGDYLVVDTSLKSVRPKGHRHFKCKEHVRQTRAVNFRITDLATGVAVTVAARAAADAGAIVPLMDATASVALRTSPELVQWLGDEEEVRRMTRAMENAEITVQEGYVREGQEVTVMGTLKTGGPNEELVIEPQEYPHNISKLMFFGKVVPFFFPVWVPGLVISDQ